MRESRAQEVEYTSTSGSVLGVSESVRFPRLQSYPLGVGGGRTSRLHAEDPAVANVLAVVRCVAARALDRAALAVLQQERAVVLEVAVDRGLLVVGRLHLVPEYTTCIENGFTCIHKYEHGSENNKYEAELERLGA